MALKDPRHKIQSSFAGFGFTNRELIALLSLPWVLPWLKSFKNATIQEDGQLEQILTGIRIPVMVYHVEIMQQSLREHQKKVILIDPHHIVYIKELIQFLRHLRNALSHSKNALIPRWDIDTDKLNKEDTEILEKFKKTGFSINIPIIKETNGCYFHEKSNIMYKMNVKIKLRKNIVLNDTFIYEMILLSSHILTITKKQKTNTIFKYLARIVNKT